MWREKHSIFFFFFFFFLRQSETVLTCTLMEWKFFLFTYWNSLSADLWIQTCVPSIQPKTFGNPCRRPNFNFRVSAAAWSGKLIQLCTHGSRALVTLVIVLLAVVCETPTSSPQSLETSRSRKNEVSTTLPKSGSALLAGWQAATGQRLLP